MNQNKKVLVNKKDDFLIEKKCKQQQQKYEKTDKKRID
jgi:hypothetical protein